jgi:mediator of RNA polymerase II transcription subunit 7
MSTAQEPAAQITNTLFPPPPEFYKQFTDDNVARYGELTSNNAGPSRSPRLTSGGITARAELSAEERQELEHLTASLGPPRSDWIEEEGRWVTFGEMSTVSQGYMDFTFELYLLAHLAGPILSS